MKEIHDLVLGAEVTVHIQYVEEKLTMEKKERINKISDEMDVECTFNKDGYVDFATDNPGKVPSILKIFGGW